MNEIKLRMHTSVDCWGGEVEVWGRGEGGGAGGRKREDGSQCRSRDMENSLTSNSVKITVKFSLTLPAESDWTTLLVQTFVMFSDKIEV